MPSPLQDAFRALQSPETELRSRKFPVSSKTIAQKIRERQKKKRDAQLIKKLINAKNSDIILDAFPVEDGDQVHAITCGDFVFGDFLLRIIEKHGIPRSMTLATLSMSLKNVEKLSKLLTDSPFPVHLLLSHYFQNANKQIFTAIETLLMEKHACFSMSIARSHAKISLFDYSEKAYVIESSANLRSSANIEQITIYHNRELYNFHQAWIQKISQHSENE